MEENDAMNDIDKKIYLDKSGDEHIYLDNLIENEHGFASYKVTPDSIMLFSVFGDGQYWLDIFKEAAKKLGKKKIMFATRRNPKAFEKKYKFRQIGVVMELEV